MILRFVFVLLIVPFLRTWPKLFVWLEEQYNKNRPGGAPPAS